MDASHRFPRTASAADITTSLARNGLAVVEDFLDANACAALKADVEGIFGERGEGDIAIGKSRLKRLFEKDLPATFRARPALRQESAGTFVKPTCDDFFGAGAWECSAIFAMHYKDEMPTNEKFHIDPSAMVKFFYYLSDFRADNGAFTYCLGSHREGYFRMRCNALDGKPGAKVIPDDEVRNATPIEGRAGTLVIFNSIGIHRAGDMKAGTERMSVTYHFGARPARDLPTRIVRKLRRTATVDYLCTYAAKHKSLSYPYSG